MRGYGLDEKEQHSNLQKYNHALFQNMLSGISSIWEISLAAETVYVMHNRIIKTREGLQYNYGVFLEKFILNHVPVPHRSDFTNHFSLESLRSLTVEILYECPLNFDGAAARAFRLTLTPGELVDGVPETVYVSLIDLETEVNEMMNNLLATNAQLKIDRDTAIRENLAKTVFLSRMSHDIRTPMNGILGMLNIAIKHREDFNTVADCLGKIRIAAVHLMSLINDVLDMRKLEAGDLTPVHLPFDLPELLVICAQVTDAMASDTNVSLVCNFDGVNIHPHLLGSPLHLRQIILNLTSNAVKYSKPENAKIFFSAREIDCDGETARIQITVKDNGIGMSHEFQTHMFEAFTQAEDGARTKYHGSGLGLTIVKKMLDTMNGTIEVHSEPNQGTEITVELPFEIDKMYTPPPVEPEPDEDPSIQNVRILLVEDNDLNMDIARTLLEDEGAIVTSAWNGLEALDLFVNSAPQTFNVILMDLMMPKMDGLTATRKIRALERPDAKTIPILAMTANAFNEDAEKCFAAGMNEHMAKPLDMRKVIRAIAKHVKANNPA